MTTPTIVLVHGAFADASSWNGVIERLQQQGAPRWSAHCAATTSPTGSTARSRWPPSIPPTSGGTSAESTAWSVPGELGLQRGALFGTQTTDSPRLRDAKPLHDLLRPDFAHSRQGFQQR
jgi:hypothetical protein